MKTTKKDFALFKRECKKWIDIFGLKGWRVYFYHETRGDGKAGCKIDVEGRVSSIDLSEEWEDDISELSIRQTAFHEACELLLGRLDAIARYRYATVSELDEARHEVIRILENILWKNNKTK